MYGIGGGRGSAAPSKSIALMLTTVSRRDHPWEKGLAFGDGEERGKAIRDSNVGFVVKAQVRALRESPNRARPSRGQNGLSRGL